MSKEEISKPEIKPGARLWMACDEKFFGPGAARLFTLIDKYRSITSACQEMDLSYSKAHLIIKKMEKLLGKKMVLVQRGGKGGASAALSISGRELIVRYEAYSKECADLIKGAFDRHFEGYEWFGKKPGKKPRA